MLSARGASVQGSSRDDLLIELLAEMRAIEADVQAGQGAAAQIDALRTQFEAACQDAVAALCTLQDTVLPPDEARRMREAALARLQDQRTQLTRAEQLRRDAAARVVQAALRVTAVRRVLEQIMATDETS
jgi:hypothetical protein